MSYKLKGLHNAIIKLNKNIFTTSALQADSFNSSVSVTLKTCQVLVSRLVAASSNHISLLLFFDLSNTCDCSLVGFKVIKVQVIFKLVG